MTSNIGTTPPNSPVRTSERRDSPERSELPLKKRQKVSHEQENDVDARIQVLLQPLLDRMGELERKVQQWSSLPAPQRVCNGLVMNTGPKLPDVEIKVMKGDNCLVSYSADSIKLKANSTYFASHLEENHPSVLHIDLDELEIDASELEWVMHSIQHCFEPAFINSIFFKKSPELDFDRILKFSLMFGLSTKTQNAIGELKHKDLKTRKNYELVKTLAEKHKIAELLIHVVNHHVGRLIDELNTSNGVIKNSIETDEALKFVRKYAHLVTKLSIHIRSVSEQYNAGLKGLVSEFGNLTTLIISTAYLINIAEIIDLHHTNIKTFIFVGKYHHLQHKLLLAVLKEYVDIVIKTQSSPDCTIFTKTNLFDGLTLPFHLELDYMVAKPQLYLGDLQKEALENMVQSPMIQDNIFSYSMLSVWWSKETSDHLLELPKGMTNLHQFVVNINGRVASPEEVMFVASFKAKWPSIELIIQRHIVSIARRKEEVDSVAEMLKKGTNITRKTSVSTIIIYCETPFDYDFITFSKTFAEKLPHTELLIFNQPNRQYQHAIILVDDPQARVVIVENRDGHPTLVRPLLESSAASSSGTTPAYPSLRSFVNAPQVVQAPQASPQAATFRSGVQGQIVNQSVSGRPGQVVNQSPGTSQRPLNQLSGASGATPPPPAKMMYFQTAAALTHRLQQMNQPTPKVASPTIAPTVSPSHSKQISSTLPPVSPLASQLVGGARDVNAQLGTLNQRLDQIAQIVVHQGIPTRPSSGSQPRPSPDEIRRQQEALDRRTPDSPSVSPAPKPKPPGKK